MRFAALALASSTALTTATACFSPTFEPGLTCSETRDCPSSQECASDNACRAPATRVVQVAAGLNHTCAALDNGELRCWGNNDFGQLGTGTTTRVLDPKANGFVGTGAFVVRVAAGHNHTCAVFRTGEARCWGANVTSQLGNGSTSDVTSPQVPPLALGEAVTDVSAGVDHSCALLESGDVKCWGAGNNGRLGSGSSSTVRDAADATVVPLGRPAVGLVTGRSHNCAQLDDGSARCWGLADNGRIGITDYNGNGLGDEPTEFANAGPIDLGSDVPIEIAAGGSHSCAAFEGGGVKCWGQGDNGRLGTGSTDEVDLPNAISNVPIDALATVAAGEGHTCAADADGQAWCWGSGTLGKLGLGTCGAAGGDTECDRGDNETIGSLSPIALPGAVESFALGLDHSCALLGDGDVVCWGGSNDGQAGHGMGVILGDDEAPGEAARVEVF